MCSATCSTLKHSGLVMCTDMGPGHGDTFDGLQIIMYAHNFYRRLVPVYDSEKAAEFC